MISSVHGGQESDDDDDDDDDDEALRAMKSSQVNSDN
jgi:hypothetical protein